MKTAVYQSYRIEDVAPWIGRCMESVRDWANAKGHDYRFVGDEIFELAPGWYRDKAGDCIPIITDYCRLVLARDLLAEGYERVIWMDADVLVFDPDGLEIDITEEFAFGSETWVQPTGRGKLKVYNNVHNALCVFTEGNSFLDFYIHACLSVVGRVEGSMVPQIVGPKLLTALNNIVGFTLIEEVGMLSPLLLRDVAEGGGPALDLYRKSAKGNLRAANLCLSQTGARDDVDVGPELFDKVCERLLADGGKLFQ